MEINEMIEVLNHFKNGGGIEAKIGNSWEKVISPSWCFYDVEYRIKREPKLVPFSFEDAELILGKSIKSKEKDIAFVVSGISKENVGFLTYNICFDDLLSSYTFLDGSPCGKFV